jgi:hypothetical protein
MAETNPKTCPRCGSVDRAFRRVLPTPDVYCFDEWHAPAPQSAPEPAKEFCHICKREHFIGNNCEEATEALTVEQPAAPPDHLKHVQRFLLEMYQTMVDPVEEFDGNIQEVCALLLRRAREDREKLNAAPSPASTEQVAREFASKVWARYLEGKLALRTILEEEFIKCAARLRGVSTMRRLEAAEHKQLHEGLERAALLCEKMAGDVKARESDDIPDTACELVIAANAIRALKEGK